MQGAANKKAMRDLKTELVSNKTLFEGFVIIKKNYENKQNVQGLSDNEVKKRIHQLDELVLKYRNIKAFFDNPQGGVVNMKDIENQMQNLRE